MQLQYKWRNYFDGSIKAENLTKKKEKTTEIIIQKKITKQKNSNNSRYQNAELADRYLNGCLA